MPDGIDGYMIGALADVNRNIAIYGTLIIDTSVDDHVFALDATTGEHGVGDAASSTTP